MKIHSFAGAVLTTSLLIGTSAIAQQGTASGQPGVTSGPASGSTVEPSTAVQKQNPSTQGTGTESAQGALRAGAPGASARSGTQGGPPPSPTGSEPGQSPTTEAAQGGVGAGSPGVTARPGTQGGPTPESGTK
jgi:hypothetical protein